MDYIFVFIYLITVYNVHYIEIKSLAIYYYGFLVLCLCYNAIAASSIKEYIFTLHH